MLNKRRIVGIKVLKGEPLDGTGRVCIHLFVQDERGPIIEPHALHSVFENGVQVKQKVAARPTRGQLACDPKRLVAPVTRGGVTTVTARTDDPQAVSCLSCKASEVYKVMMSRIALAAPVVQ